MRVSPKSQTWGFWVSSVCFAACALFACVDGTTPNCAGDSGCDPSLGSTPDDGSSVPIDGATPNDSGHPNEDGGSDATPDQFLDLDVNLGILG